MNYKKIIIGLAVIIVVIIVGIFYIQSVTVETPESETFFYSFEKGELQGWSKDGTDLLNPPINWSVNITDIVAFNGTYSASFYLNNLNDAGKIWLENNYTMEPNKSYKVEISYYFGTADYGDVNLFKIITGASSYNPETGQDLIYQGDTGHHQDTQELVWLHKNFSYNVETNSDGKIVVFIGVWGTWETSRIYFIDDIIISINETDFNLFN